MSDVDNLRDRIADILEALDGRDFGQVAQAIIDEFGLTVEERIDEPGKRGINPVQRVVGKWEKQ
ncbi:hypothetical protein [Brevibacterium oceani]|uniref:hypothetical protein n=1 Tax=Brevibacterium oceani TaxID=358099 RepID=UPI0015E7C9B9|nr:hypothetical protein [Brevibacterium oceani]